jgi:hypothetical protein
MKKVILSLLLLAAAPVFGQPRGTIAQQKMCAEQANKFAHEDRNKSYDGSTGSWQSHYDAAAHVCYVMLDTHYSSHDVDAGRLRRL